MTAQRPEIPALTGFRFYAALLVVVTHFCSTHLTKAGYTWAENMTVFASIGMSMFFVLSGFVIHYNYGDDVAHRRPGELYRFAVARFARLYPLFIFATAISIATAPAMQPYQWSALPYWLTMTHGWLPISIAGRFPGDAMTPGSWSVSVEVLLYILFIPLAMVMRSQLRSQRDILSVALIAGLGLFIFHGARAITGIGAAPDWLWYRSVAARLPEFLAGMVAAEIFMRRMATPVAALERRGVALMAAVTVLGLVAVADGYTMRPLPLWAEAMSQNWFVAPFFAVAIYTLARFDIHSLFLESKPVLALGDASYSIYLLHPTVIWMFAWQGTQKGAPFIEFKALVTFIAIGLFSLGVYRYLEWPARRFIRHVLLPAPGASPRYWPGQRFFRLRS